MARFNKKIESKFGISLSAVLLSLCIAGGSAQAQNTAVSAAAPVAVPAGTATPTTTTTSAPANTPATANAPTEPMKESLLIGPGDLLHISVFDEPEMDQRVRVSDAGEVTLSLIGKVKVSGMTPPEAATAIRNKYQAGSFLNDPQVSISVDEYTGESVSLVGQFQRPGPVTLPTPRGLLDVISMGGGFTDVADHNITIQRKSGEKVKVMVPNKADAALEQSSVLVYPGDTIIAPKAGIVYVLGDVGRPGGYVMNNDSQITVLQALAMASGTNKTAKESKARLVRKEEDKVTEQRLQLNAMQKGEAPDIPLQNNDVIWVPFSWLKNFGSSAASIAASTSSAAIYTTR
jgi:polysaccharide biosynthesis/export protein